MPTHAERGELAESDVFHILGNDRRREIVSVLAAEDERIDVSEIARTVASREIDGDGSVPNNLYKSVYVSLQQTHLPQLEADGIVVYDTDAKTIKPGPQFDHVRAYIDGSTAVETTALYAVVTIAVTGIASIGLSGAGVPGIDSLSPITWALVALIGVALAGLVGAAWDGSPPEFEFG